MSRNADIETEPRGAFSARCTARRLVARAHLRRLIVGALAVALTLIVGCPPPPPSFVVTKDRVRIGIVQTQGDVRISGLAPLRGWGEQRDSPFMHALEVVINGLGRDVDYDELMGLSGFAFRTQFHVDAWDPSVPDPLVGSDCVRPLVAAIGFDCEVHYLGAGAGGETHRKIVESIDHGLPVLATNLIPPENWGIVTGYRDGGRTLWCRVYDAGDAGPALAQDVVATSEPTAVLFVRGRRPRPDAALVHKESIGWAVRQYEQPAADGFAFGAAAFDAWCRMLEHLSSSAALQTNAWTYVSLVDARGAAARYLRRIAPEFGLARGAIERAATAYERERQLLVDHLDAIAWPRDHADGVAPADKVRRQIATLREAAKLEASAIAAMRLAR